MKTLLAIAVLTVASSPATAATFYVGPNSTVNDLSANPAAPGTLAFAVSHAPENATVLLEDGTYVSAPGGFSVSVSNVTFRAVHWHGARVTNPAGPNLWGPARGAINDVVQGIVFGPCAVPAAGGYSGGGGDGWQFKDCAFIQNDGMGFSSGGVVEHCLFSDGWFNSFDVNNCHGFLMRNTIVRRGNRANADDDATGNKVDLATAVTFDGLIDYDNVGPGLWFDTACNNWVVKNSTFFANHGARNWFEIGIRAGLSPTQFTCTGQDGEGLQVGEHLMGISGTPANLHYETIVTAVQGYNPQTVTVSPALPAAPVAGDELAGQHGGGGAVGVMSEANPNGTFTGNVTYNNTGSGLFDADSGDGYGVTRPGVIITNNQFFYDGIGFRDINLGAKIPTRALGAATIQHNEFRIGALTGRNAFHPGGPNYLLGYPGPRYHIDFDYNTYQADPGYTGSWADWYYFAGGPKTDFHPSSLADLQNPTSFNQDHHSRVGPVAFRGRTVRAYDWPAKDDRDWTHIYHPNNTYGAVGSIHQVQDDETPYIERAVTGKRSGQAVSLKVFGHMPIEGSGPYTCEVFDYSGRWMQLTLPTAADRAALDADVPGYAVLEPCPISVRLTSTGPYDLTGVFVRPRARPLGSHAVRSH